MFLDKLKSMSPPKQVTARTKGLGPGINKNLLMMLSAASFHRDVAMSIIEGVATRELSVREATLKVKMHKNLKVWPSASAFVSVLGRSHYQTFAHVISLSVRVCD